jgi:hypothetical protein
MIDFGGLTLIRRIKSDKTEILFAKRPVEDSIEDFWAAAESQEYKYIHQL